MFVKACLAKPLVTVSMAPAYVQTDEELRVSITYAELVLDQVLL
jgi:hypothetical protein